MGKNIVLAGSSKTAFLFRIDGGMDERDKDEMESMDSGYVLGPNWPSIISDSVDLHHRMKYIRQRNLGFSFQKVLDEDFNRFLEGIDGCLPKTIASMLADFYRDGTKMMSDLLENCQRRNPAGFKNVLESRVYPRLIGRFLKEIAPPKYSEYTEEQLIAVAYLDRIPADKYDCASITGNIHTGYYTKLILQIILE